MREMFKLKQQKTKTFQPAKIAGVVHKSVRDVIRETGERVYEISQILVPVDKGDLKASGAIEIKRDGDTVEVSYGTDHSLAQEFGTHNTAAQPYLRPAAEQVAQESGKRMGDIITRTEKGLK